MKLLRHKVEQLKIGWNERELGDVDVYRICRKYKVEIVEMPLRVSGFYYRVKGRDFIAVNSMLSGKKRLAVMFHELGHFLLHVPESGTTANFHRVGERTRKEREADLFALCALIPTARLSISSEQELIDEGFDEELVAERLDIFKTFGL
ncbi:MAG TPA: ImmA/IrrE family metallo-endopeptidase [Pyrinomonadaceae bacterium]|mgnify:CR=1 FL=1|nr:ImmA/IrrE family metallo-endopeptidase [Pyrinomonadaceae bacterium]